MTQRIFDIENKKDMADLWDTLREDITKIEQFGPYNRFYTSYHHETHDLIKINWHNKTEITRPIQEATEVDVGKLCKFWDDERFLYFGILDKIENIDKENWYRYRGNIFPHCRRLTKQEIEELC